MTVAHRRPRGSRVPLDACPDPVELILYVSSDSARSAITIEDIRRTLQDLRSPRVTLTIRDAMVDQGNHEELQGNHDEPLDRSSAPRTFILGHVTSHALLLELLAECAQG